MYLVDTNVLSEARRGTREAVRWFHQVQPHEVHVSVITLGEITRGITLKKNSDPTAANRLSGWLKALREDYASRILGVDDRIAMEWGRLVAQRPRGDADGLIAATAIVHDLMIVTRNSGHFGDLPVPVLNPWRDAI